LSNNADLTYTGILYFPDQPVEFTNVTHVTIAGALIADTIMLSQNATLSVSMSDAVRDRLGASATGAGYLAE
jgi:hypothetical protein